MIPTFEEFLNSYYEKNNMLLSYKDFVNPDPDDVKLIKEAMRLLKYQKDEIIEKRKKIDNMRFWIFSIVLPAIPLYFLSFYLIGLDIEGPNSHMYTKLKKIIILIMSQN